jgi:hypothetical protein
MNHYNVLLKSTKTTSICFTLCRKQFKKKIVFPDPCAVKIILQIVNSGCYILCVTPLRSII